MSLQKKTQDYFSNAWMESSLSFSYSQSYARYWNLIAWKYLQASDNQYIFINFNLFVTF